jgi:hypothetical protein
MNNKQTLSLSKDEQQVINQIKDHLNFKEGTKRWAVSQVLVEETFQSVSPENKIRYELSSGQKTNEFVGGSHARFKKALENHSLIIVNDFGEPPRPNQAVIEIKGSSSRL